jgi:hypothetical protein
MFKVKAEELAKVGYDSNNLNIQFHSGELFAYYKVPPHIYGGLLSAKSLDAYFNENFKGRFGETKLN